MRRFVVAKLGDPRLNDILPKLRFQVVTDDIFYVFRDNFRPEVDNDVISTAAIAEVGLMSLKDFMILGMRLGHFVTENERQRTTTDVIKATAGRKAIVAFRLAGSPPIGGDSQNPHPLA